MPSAKAKTVAASLTLCGACLGFFMGLRGGSPKYDPAPQEAAGAVLAEETVKLAGSAGRITVIARDTALFANPAADSLLKGFCATLKRGGRTVTATNLVKLDPLRLVRVPPGDFYELLRKQTDRDVVVSFLGPPLLAPEQKARLGEKSARIVAFCPGPLPRQVNLVELFEQNMLHVVVISRPHPPLTPPSSPGGRAWFDYLYQVITSANLAEMPVPLENKLP
jgi:hypothetical protein